MERYEEGLAESMRGSEFIFDNVDALYYDLNKISLSRGESYIDSSEWLKNKKATINFKNYCNKCFQYALTLALNYEQTKKDPQTLPKVKLFIYQYKWKEISFPSHQNDWKRFESNNKTKALNVLYVPHNTEERRHAYKSKYNLKRENQVILLMITDGAKWHYLAVKKLSALLRGTTGNNNADFYCVIIMETFTL